MFHALEGTSRGRAGESLEEEFGADEGGAFVGEAVVREVGW
jgi:hypothetical protein